MKLPAPRPYQEKGINLMRQAFMDGHRNILFFLATGGGKSVIFLHVVNNLIQSMPTILIMRRRQIVLQAYRHFKKHGIDASIVMANDKRFDAKKDLQICSIDTVNSMLKRGKEAIFNRFKACVIDEAHDCTSDSYKRFLEYLSPSISIGLTASPFPVGNKVHDYWHCCVKPIEMHDLRKAGYLAPCKVLVPTDIDLSNIKTVSGEYHQGQLASKMSESSIVGDIVETYKKHGQNKPAILFAVNKDHSREMAESFNLAGIPAIHCDESTKQDDRDKAIENFQKGKIKVLCNVNIFSTGVDIPEAEIGIMARPTQSEILYIQQVGRLLRPYRLCGRCKKAYDNSPRCYHCGHDRPQYIKEKALIFDHGNNISRFGSPYKVRMPALTQPALTQEEKEQRKRESAQEIKTKVCKECFAAFMGHLSECPYCGHTNEKRQRVIKNSEGKLVPYDEFEEIKNRLHYYQRIMLEKNLKPNFPYFKIYEEFGDVVMKFNELKVPRFIPKIVNKNKAEKFKGVLYG